MYSKLKFYSSIFFIAVISQACNNSSHISGSEREKDSLLLIQKQDQESINQFIIAFNEIQRNLDSVAVKQNIIFLNTDRTERDLKLSQKTRILEEIQSINLLMTENVSRLDSLKRKLSNTENSNKHLRESVAILNKQLLRKNQELLELNERLAFLDLEVAVLKNTIDTLLNSSQSKSYRIQDQLKSIHTAYYVVGKSRELLDAKLIDRKGGLLGFGRMATLSDNFDQEKFNCIDYTKCSTIPVNSGATIITTHPKNSYTLDRDLQNKSLIKNLIITDPVKFWSASKYLVIVKS
ncbi:MAG: hypothetical protein K0R26_946 [Bacteroidota bacterium]|jgi:hypothetical protein|nr:hypothetical protein [Bacteroidota bacterium]